MFWTVLTSASLRYFLHHPWQLGLALMGIALGVAVVVAIDLASTSARHSFSDATLILNGGASHQISGGSHGLDERLFVRLRFAHPEIAMAPVIETRAELPSLPGRQITLLGVDPISERLLRPFFGVGAGADVNWRALISEPASVVVAASMAEALALTDADTLSVSVGGVSHVLTVVGTSQGGPVGSVLGAVALVDLSTAQEMLGKVGRIDRIDLVLPRSSDELALSNMISAALPGGVRLAPSTERAENAAAMTRAFDLNLTMLSLLGLVIGMFLIYNTVSFAVVQRQSLLGSLRSLGVTRGQVLTLVLREALILGIVGAVLGIALGSLLATQLTQLIARTINDLYYTVDVPGVVFSASVLIKALGLGVVAALLAALIPALEACSVAPRVALARSVMESRLRALLPKVTVAAVFTIGLGYVMAQWPTTSLAVGYLSVLVMVIGFVLLAPFATLCIVRILRPLVGWVSIGIGPLSVGGLATSLSRTSVAIAALMVALGGSIGIASMVESFRYSVVDWLDSTLQADVYVNAPNSSTFAIDSQLVRRIEKLPQVEEIQYTHRFRTQSQFGLTNVHATQMARRGYASVTLLDGEPAAVWRAFESSSSILISESYAWHHGIGVGESVRLLTPVGEQDFIVGGIFRDYGSEHGVVVMSHNTYARYWSAFPVSTMAIFAVDSEQAQRLADQVRLLSDGQQVLNVRLDTQLKEATLAVFDQTFKITTVLRLLATVVAFIGVLSALMALQLERMREVAILRAIGFTRSQIATLVITQTALTGAIAGLLSLPLGLIVAQILTDAVNRRAFGWTLQFVVDSAVFYQGFLLAVVAAVLAGLVPALNLTKAAPAVALRQE